MLKRLGKSRYVWLLLTALGGSALDARHQPDALALLDKAVAAARAIDTVSYKFESGSPAGALGFVVGEVRMKRRTNYVDSWILVSGTVREMPQQGLKDAGFAFATDGERSYSLDHAEKQWASAALVDDPDAAARLIGFGAWGVLRDFVEHKPYWMELTSAVVLKLENPMVFAGVPCNVLLAAFDSPRGLLEVRWYFGREDHLPRGQRWSSATTGQGGDFLFTIQDLRTGLAVERDDFRLAAPSGYVTTSSDLPGAQVGNPAPDWQLTTHTGEPLSLQQLRGKVVVMDFWNSSCYLCHNMMPGIQALHEELRGQDVVILGFNIWEQGDAAAYWRERGFTYPFLPQSDDVAQRYGVVVQPSVVVVGKDGKVVFSQNGAVPDRKASIRAAIQGALREPLDQAPPRTVKKDSSSSGR